MWIERTFVYTRCRSCCCWRRLRRLLLSPRSLIPNLLLLLLRVTALLRTSSVLLTLSVRLSVARVPRIALWLLHRRPLILEKREEEKVGKKETAGGKERSASFQLVRSASSPPNAA